MLSPLGDDRASQICLQVIPSRNLREAMSLLEGETHLNPPRIDLCDLFTHRPDHEPDFANVKAQESIKRALDLAAAGSHNVLLIGPPGTCKSILAVRLATILPLFTLNEALEIIGIHSIMGLLEPGQALNTRRPFRAPHHTACDAGLLGGDINPTPGGNMPGKCHCSPREIANYLNRGSGPLLHRIDLHIEVPAVKFQDITSQRKGEASALAYSAARRWLARLGSTTGSRPKDHLWR